MRNSGADFLLTGVGLPAMMKHFATKHDIFFLGDSGGIFPAFQEGGKFRKRHD